MSQNCVECGYQSGGQWDECPDCGWIPYWEREIESTVQRANGTCTDPEDFWDVMEEAIGQFPPEIDGEFPADVRIEIEVVPSE